MAARRYRQICGLAVGLDVIGERWTLLIIRDLLMGPKRYSDLLARLPGIGTNLLAARLKSLESHGVLHKRELPRPASGTVYELTGWGMALEPTIQALAQWGMKAMDQCQPDDYRQISWPILGLRPRVDPERLDGVSGVLQLVVGDQRAWLSVEDGEFSSGDGVRDRVGATITTDSATIRGLIFRGMDLQDAAATVDGDAELAQRMLRVFVFSKPVA